MTIHGSTHSHLPCWQNNSQVLPLLGQQKQVIPTLLPNRIIVLVLYLSGLFQGVEIMAAEVLKQEKHYAELSLLQGEDDADLLSMEHVLEDVSSAAGLGFHWLLHSGQNNKSARLGLGYRHCYLLLASVGFSQISMTSFKVQVQTPDCSSSQPQLPHY